MKSLISKILRKIHKICAFETILVLGDSHVAVFDNKNFIKKFPLKYFKVCSVGGATASGLKNPRSKTQAFETFDKFLQENSQKKVIVMLGEVDTGFVIWYRAKKYNSSVEEMFQQAVSNYSDFIKKIAKNKELLVISTPLPTIDDNSTGEVVHARKEITTSQKERTELTIKFNKTIEEICQLNNIKYLNLDTQSIGSNGIVKDELKNKDLTDHHYDTNRHANLIIKNLRSFV